MSDQPATPPSGVTPGYEGPTTGTAALQHRDFAIFFWGKTLCFMSTQMILTAVGYQVYDVTGNPALLALIGLSTVVPQFSLVLFTGYVADVLDRKSIVVVCYTLLGLTAAGICLFTLLDMPVSWPLYAMTFLMGTARGFMAPASNALVATVVPREVFPNAAAWNTSCNKVTQIAGPSIGGLLYLLGPEVVYATATVCFFAGAATMTLIKAPPRERGQGKLAKGGLFAGLVYVYQKKLLLGAVGLDLAVGLLGNANTLIPIFAKDILDVGPAGAGFLRSAMAVGGLAGAITLTRFTITHSAGKIMLLGVAVFGLATIGFALSTTFYLSAAAVFVLGYFDMINTTIRNTLIQIATPDHMRGRVGAVSSVSANASNDLGGFRAGLVAAWVGAEASVLLGGIAVLVVAAAMPKMFPELARAERLDRVL